jgi:hypothetical protein
MSIKVAAIYNTDLNYSKKNKVYDEYLEAFSLGTGAMLSDWESEKESTRALIIRGVSSTSQRAIKHCWETGRDFYSIDTGYFGNQKTKTWHRITKNNLQLLGPIVDRPDDRLKKIGYSFRKFTGGRKILICPPSEKIMNLFGQPLPQDWVDWVIQELKEYTDRPVEVRIKPSRIERTTTNTIESALADDVHCLITYNSIAAVEALMCGKPAIALGPNAAQTLCNTTISSVENLYTPTKDEMHQFMCHLSYGQFNRHEMQSGYAWEILNESR